MTIRLATISFNHDPDSADSDAFTIRKNQLEDVLVPEWTQGMNSPADSPAVYSVRQFAANRTITIKAEFRRDPNDPASVEIRANDLSGNVLGSVSARTIHFGNQLSADAIFELNLPPGNPGVGVQNIIWEWFAGNARLQRTQHRIYTILDEPKEPWGQPGSLFPLPWTEVLEYACVEARGARTADEAAAKLTEWIYSLGDDGKLDYDNLGGGSSNFTILGETTFNCTRFLRVLSGQIATARVNCTDCATILSSFANVLGCDLTQSRIGNRFFTNPVQLIGSGGSSIRQFNFHEVAWKFPDGGTASLYDCCLRVDKDLLDNKFSPILGTDIPFDVPDNSDDYRFRLIATPDNGITFGELRRTRVRRKIDGQTTVRITEDPGQRQQLEEQYAFPEWHGTPDKCKPHYKQKVAASEKGSASGEQLFLKNYSFGKVLQPPDGWSISDIQFFKAEPDPLRLTDVIWRSKGCSGAALRVLTYECSSISAARSFLLTLLGEFNLPGIERRLRFLVSDKVINVGDVAFAGSDDLVVLFARANNVISIQNVGRTLVPASQFAAAIDRDLTSGPDRKLGKLVPMNQFYISDKEIRVGEEIRIHTRPEQVKKKKEQDQEPLLRFFTPRGQVLFKGDDLLYRPLVAGGQAITIVAHNAEGETSWQVLRFLARESANSHETECKDLNPSEEENVMPSIMGTWSSRRPQNVGETLSADMTVEGYIEITGRHPVTGEITGTYRDPARDTVEEIHGRVRFVLPNSYSITLNHKVIEGTTRYYEGQLVAVDDTDGVGVQIVAGRYTDVFEEPEALAAGATDSAIAANDGQANGTWVATKP